MSSESQERVSKALHFAAASVVAKGFDISAANELALDSNGGPLPWLTYPALDYLRGLNLRDKTIFEFGSGCSTLYWAKHFKRVTSIENNEVWFKKLLQEIPNNCEIRLRTTRESYLSSIDEDGVAYDVIVVDGAAEMSRCGMAEKAITRLSSGGFVILDNSDVHVRAGEILRTSGLLQVDMIGLCPGNRHESATTFFFDRRFTPEPIEQWLPKKTTYSMKHYILD